MAAIVQAQANSILNATLAGGGTSTVGATTGIKCRLTTTAPTNTTAGTELTGTGYTAGGQAVTFGTASSGSITNTTTLSWTNSSGSSWSIVGLELWDLAGTPLRWWFGTWTGQPISVANGNTFAVAASAITITLT